jgi:hypothetical protein
LPGNQDELLEVEDVTDNDEIMQNTSNPQQLNEMQQQQQIS